MPDAPEAARPLLFVAREPDETLRVFLPVLAEPRLRARECLVLFHHQPGPWAQERLAELGVMTRQLRLPARGDLRLPPTLAELVQLWRARRLASRLIDEIDPAVVVVIQDTLLLERFLVREANRRGRGTIVVQWAFTFPQAIYDRLNEIQRGCKGVRRRRVGGVVEALAARRPRSAVRRRLYALVRRSLGVRFDLARSYGGGEARVFAVMGEVFRDQFLAQGVRKQRIEVTGHPLHDAAYQERQRVSAQRQAELKARHGLPVGARVVLYTTQPVLWRAVLSREELNENVRALGEGVRGLGPEFLLLVKIHPRESIEDYAPAAASALPIRVLKEAEIVELIGLADAFISSSSSTVLLAMMLDRPIVTVNFNQVPHFDYYETVGGTLHSRTPPEAVEALRLAVFDAPTRARLADERAQVLTRFSRFDGRATERLADLVLSEARG